MPPSAGACHTIDAELKPDCGRAADRSSIITAIGWRRAAAGVTGRPVSGAGTRTGVGTGVGVGMGVAVGLAEADGRPLAEVQQIARDGRALVRFLDCARHLLQKQIISASEVLLSLAD